MTTTGKEKSLVQCKQKRADDTELRRSNLRAIPSNPECPQASENRSSPSEKATPSNPECPQNTAITRVHNKHVST